MGNALSSCSHENDKVADVAASVNTANSATMFCLYPTVKDPAMREPGFDMAVPSWRHPVPQVGNSAAFLAWTLCDGISLLEESRLASLHSEIARMSHDVGGAIVESSATEGLLVATDPRLADESGDSMSPEDCIVRLGQLLCRWAVQQEPPLSLRVGAHSGNVSMMTLPNGSQAFYGEAVFQAKRLAQSAPNDCCVHILKSTKGKLNVLERLPFTLSKGNESYYLEPSSLMPEEAPLSVGHEVSPDSSEVCTPEFRNMLIEHGIDISLFGKGQARTLDEFYRNVVVQKKSYLIGHYRPRKLERHMELVHISLQAVGKNGQYFELRLESEIMQDGCLVRRNQRPVISVEEGAGWKVAFDLFLERRLGLTPAIRHELLEQKSNTYSRKVEQVASMFFPGVKTTYTTHEITAKILNPNRKELEAIALPQLTNFDTAANPAANIFMASWSWRLVGEELSNEEGLARLLQEYGIDTNDYPPESVAELCDELYGSKYATLNLLDGQLVRNIQIIKVWLCSTILSVEYVLRSKGKLQKGKRQNNHKEGPVTMQMHANQAWQQSVYQCLCDKLGMDPAFFDDHIVVVDSSYRLDEEIAYSRSYPGLKTVYNIHNVKCRVKDVYRPEMAFIGLPDGNDFSFSSSRRSQIGMPDNIVSSVQWSWKPRSQLADMPDSLYIQKMTTDKHQEVAAKRQLTPPAFLQLDNDVPRRCPDGGSLPLEYFMTGRTTDWKRARNAAKRILDPTYSLQSFYDDCTVAFPELALYTVDQTGSTNSGRTASDEYQRTIGALFAFFWLMRRQMGGSQSFCFGVDDDWNQMSEMSTKPRRSAEERAKRMAFMREVEWDRADQLLQDAGMLLTSGSHDEERTLAMLVLTAIHDIMKLPALLPIVSAKHAGFGGYVAGDLISDHDVALGYVLLNFPSALPSFAGLCKQSQDTIRFTQLKMEYNMGWLVQAEAPPGALFRKFKECVQSGGAAPKDVAFYFCHWLTDLAGAEPYPQEGCEKFVLRFPRKVLSSFLNSFSIVRELAVKSEAQVYEDYLIWRWKLHSPELGQVPEGPGAIAALRLVIMAQGDSKGILSAMQNIPLEDLQILTDELSMTGIKDQIFTLDALPGTISKTPTAKLDAQSGKQQSCGPAILVYYAPALMQKAGSGNPRGTLRILAEILRQARALWPLIEDAANDTITVRIDALKELEVSAISQLTSGEVWTLEKTTSRDAEVKKISLVNGSSSELTDSNIRVLNLGPVPGRHSLISVNGTDSQQLSAM